jgi:hypothetical protein
MIYPSYGIGPVLTRDEALAAPLKAFRCRRRSRTS